MKIEWHRALNELIPLLAGLYPERDKARYALRRAGLEPEEIDWSGSSKIVWLRIVEELNRRQQVDSLIAVAKQDYPNLDLDALERQLEQAPPGSRLGDDGWKGKPVPAGVLERVIGKQPTFLPVRFLEVGLLRARSVARVESPLGLGTGFLTRNNLLITNHHVIATPEHARRSRIWFNFQETVAKAESAVAEFLLDPDAGFATSPLEGGDDWTTVRLQGDASARWGAIDLLDTTVETDDFVNIIQHPGGLPKQIALYHNLVAFADDRRVQYLTDTLPGSSGSPVFDSDWRVVAVHHSGGWLPEPGTDRVFFRNEGIHVRTVIRGLREHGLLEN